MSTSAAHRSLHALGNTKHIRTPATPRLLAALALFTACTRPTANCPEPAPVPPPALACEAAIPTLPMTATRAATEAVALINAGDVATLRARFSADLQQVAAPDALRAFFDGILAARGKLIGATAIVATDRVGTFRLTAERGAWQLDIALTDDDIIAGLAIREPAADSTPPPVARSASAGLPFRGEWLVFWGGDMHDQNHHVDHPSQRRAADLVKVDDAGSTHRGAGKDLKDYYAYGQDVLAMVDGVVVTAIDGIPDSVPGELDGAYVTGNFVVLRHDGGVHSAYAHLAPGSLKVKQGNRVRRGQVIGACGNSGYSSEPHLHVQFQDGPRFDRSWGVEPVFTEVLVVRDGARAERRGYTFLKGDRVAPLGASVDQWTRGAARCSKADACAAGGTAQPPPARRRVQSQDAFGRHELRDQVRRAQVGHPRSPVGHPRPLRPA